MFQVFIRSRRLSDTYPALLSFLGWAQDRKDIRITLFLNSLTDHNPKDRILELFPPETIEVLLNPDTIENCDHNWPKFYLKSIQRYKQFLTGKYGDTWKEFPILMTDDDIYFSNAVVLNDLEIVDLPIAPELFPKYENNAGEFDKKEAQYWDFYGLTIKGEWIDLLLEGLTLANNMDLKVGSGTLATAFMCSYLKRNIAVISNVKAYSTKKESRKEGILEESYNYLILKASEYEK